MLWFFERNNESVSIETRYDNTTSEYVAVITYPDGRSLVERFSDASLYRTWLESLEEGLEGERWVRKGPPVILPEGWPKGRPS